MEHDNDSVSILGHILEKESTEVIETTKKTATHHSVPVSSLDELSEELLSIQNIEEPMTVFLEKNNSNIPDNIDIKLEDVSFD